MKKMIMLVIMMVVTMMVGCGKPQTTAYVRAYDGTTNETLGYICEVDGKIYIMADHDNADELVEMVQEELENMIYEIN